MSHVVSKFECRVSDFHGFRVSEVAMYRFFLQVRGQFSRMQSLAAIHLPGLRLRVWILSTIERSYHVLHNSNLFREGIALE